MRRPAKPPTDTDLHYRLHKAGVELIHRTPSLISSLIAAGRSERRVRKVCRDAEVPQRPTELIVGELCPRHHTQKGKDKES